MACNWFLARDEKVIPTVRLAAIKTRESTRTSEKTSSHGNVEKEPGRHKDQKNLHIPHKDIGQNFAQHDFQRVDRGGEQALHGAALRFPGDGQSRDDHQGERQNNAHESGNDIVLRNGFRVVLGVNTDVHGKLLRGQRRKRAFQILLQGPSYDFVKSGHGVAGSGRIRGVSLQQQDRAFSPHDPSPEKLGDGQDELNGSASKHFLRVGAALGLPNHMKVAAGLHGCDDGS